MFKISTGAMLTGDARFCKWIGRIVFYWWSFIRRRMKTVASSAPSNCITINIPA